MASYYSSSHPSYMISPSSTAGMEYDLDYQLAINNSLNQSRASWDHHYQRRGRTQERFDFPTSDDFDSIHDSDRNVPVTRNSGWNVSSQSQEEHQQPQQQQQQTPINHPIHQRRSRPRPRSADSRPQYNHHHTAPSVGGTSSSSFASSISRDRATCFNNMFYPGELTTSAGLTGSVQNTYRYYPSELPRYDPLVHDDTAYTARRGQHTGPRTGTDISDLNPGTAGVGLSSTSSRNQQQQQQRNQPTFEPASGRQQQQRQMKTAVFMLPGNPYESTIVADSRVIDQHHPSDYTSTRVQHHPTKNNTSSTDHHHHHRRLYEDRDRRHYDYAKENLLMFGDGYGRPGGPGDTPSVSTGLSQEELLQRKRRDETWRKRKEKRQQHHPRKPGRTNKVVNIPTSLFSPHTNRQQQQQQQEQQQQEKVQEQQQKEQRQPLGPTVTYRDVMSEVGNQPKEDDDNNGINHIQPLVGTDEVFRPSFSNSGIGMRDYTGQTAASSIVSSKKDVPDETKTSLGGGGDTSTTTTDRTRGGQQKGDNEENANSSLDNNSNNNNTNNNKGSMGIRGSMVRRQRNSNQSSSAGRRWKILPSLSRSHSDSNKANVASTTTKKPSEGISRKADPPARKESSGSWHLKSLDPSLIAGPVKEPIKEGSVTAQERAISKESSGVAAPGESKSKSIGDNDVSVQGTDDGSRLLFAPSHDDFDRFMDEPNIISSKTTRSLSFDPGRKTDIDLMSAEEEYLTVSMVADRTATSSGIKRPTYADFTPKSDYTRKLFLSVPGHMPTKERSPTSAMDFPPGGVRWCETLTQQEFVLPQSAKLDPSSDHRVRRDPLMEQPKSILRKRSSSAAVRSPTKLSNQFDVRSYWENDDSCPSDESPTKPVKANRGFRVYPDSSEVDRLINDPKIAFVDDRGRSVSPIVGASGSQFSEQDVEEVAVAEGLDTIPKWNNGHSSSFERNIPTEFQEAFMSENQISKVVDDTGLLSDSYVTFIEAVASVVIQTKVRQFLSSMRVLRLRERLETLERLPADRRVKESKDATEVIIEAKPTPLVSRSQILAMKARSSVSSRRDDVALDFFDLAAIQIQAAFRGWWVRDCLSVDNYCASMIQKTYRGYACRCRFNEKLRRVVLVQSAWRRFLAIDTAVTRMYCIVRLQSIARGFLTRMRLLPRKINDRDVHELAATKVQAQWRSFACEMRFLRAYEDILVVQSLVRGWITRRLLRSWLKAHKMIASSRLQGQTKASSRSMEHANVRYERQPNQNGNRTPSPKKPSKRSDISPSYVNHIEYMRKALGPEPLEKAFRGMPENDPKRKMPDVVRRLCQDSTDQVLNDSMAPETKMKEEVKSPSAARETLNSEAEGAELKPSKDQSDTPKGGSWAGRSAIEQRRKLKELEAKAKEQEEQRRKDAQAAELAELEFRRQRMALKAEARKKQLEASKLEISEAAEVSDRMETFSNDEEKKENDSVVMQTSDVVSHPPDELVNGPNERLDTIVTQEVLSKRQTHLTSSGALPFGNVPDFTPTTVLKRHGQWSFAQSRSHECLQEERQETTQTQSAKKSINAQAGKSTSVPRKGGVVADRMRQIMTSSANGASGDVEDVEKETLTTKEKNVVEGQLQDVSPAPGNTNIGASNSTLLGSPEASNEDTLNLSVANSIEPGIKRVALTSTAYGDEMRSLRSEAEQKRIDAMHVIFEKAGLLARVKKAG